MENIFIQYMFLFFVSMVPFLEAFLTVPTAIIIFQIQPLIVLIIAVIGNVISVFLFVFFGTEINKLFRLTYNKTIKRNRGPTGINPRFKQAFDRYGPVWVCFLSSILFSSQIGAVTMTALGSSKRHVLLWTNLGVGSLAVVMAVLSVMAENLVQTMVDL